jgi:uncharacterized damage-inducible protein DinB
VPAAGCWPSSSFFGFRLKMPIPLSPLRSPRGSGEYRTPGHTLRGQEGGDQVTDPQFPVSSEREALCGFLDQQRGALIRKVQGAGDEAARTAPTVSSMSLLGLIKHSAIWEHRWFEVIFAGHRVPGEWPDTGETEDEIDAAEWRIGEHDTTDGWVARYREQAEVSRQITAGRELGTPCAFPDLAQYNLRWVLLHMIEETARHAGHADIIRETLDGTRGL